MKPIDNNKIPILYVSLFFMNSNPFLIANTNDAKNIEINNIIK